MPDLAVTIQANGVVVAPGSSASFTVEVHNLGTIVDRYRCEIVGMDPGWVTVSPASMELFPQNGDARSSRPDAPPSVGRFTVTLHPPRLPAAAAGPWPIGARVTSEHDAGSRRVEETTVAMLPFGALDADLHPSLTSGRFGATAIVQISNKGNRSEAVTLIGSDPADKLAFQFRPPTANLGAGESIGVATRLSGGGLKLVGGAETRPFKIDVRASSPDTDARALSGSFERRALVPSGVPMAAAVVVALGLAAAAVLGLTRPPSGTVGQSAPASLAVVSTPSATPSPSPSVEVPPSTAPPTSEPSAPPTEPPTEPPTAPPLPPDTCVSGFVWREAFDGDHVCVTPEERTLAADDNAAAASRVDPGGAYGPNTCLSGFVWRVARAEDLVCVTPEQRQQVADDNAAASSRVVGP